MIPRRIAEIPVRLVINGVAKAALYDKETLEQAEERVRKLKFQYMCTSSATTVIVVNDAEIEFVGVAQEKKNEQAS